MANNIVLKTYKGGSVTPLDDAIIQQTVIVQNVLCGFPAWELVYSAYSINYK